MNAMPFQRRIDRFCAQHPDAPRDAILASRLLFHTARVVRRTIESALRPHDLNMEQYLTLSLLSTDEGEPSSPSMLCEAMDVTRTQMTRLLDYLEGRGWLHRRPNGGDRRGIELRISEAGRDHLEAAARDVHRAYEAVWGVLDASDREELARDLGHMHARLLEREGGGLAP